MNKIENAIAKSELYNKAIRKGADIRSDAFEDAARTVASGQMWASGIRGIGGALAPSIGTSIGNSFRGMGSKPAPDLNIDAMQYYSDTALDPSYGLGRGQWPGTSRGSW
jgi:hypothetical protein